jgi:hypothetical protein
MKFFLKKNMDWLIIFIDKSVIVEMIFLHSKNRNTDHYQIWQAVYGKPFYVTNVMGQR